MADQTNAQTSKTYFIIVVSIMLILPTLSIFIEYWNNKAHFSATDSFSKWFVFWGVGVRLLTAGIKQVSNPSFTAQSIFHISNKESFTIVRELGFANFCMGSIGVISLFIADWRMAAAFAGGLFFGIAGVNHIIKKPAGSNEMIALVSDIFIFLVMLASILLHYT